MRNAIWFPHAAEVGINPYGFGSSLFRKGPARFGREDVVPGINEHKPMLVMLHLCYGAHFLSSPDGRTDMTNGWDIIRKDLSLPAALRDIGEWEEYFKSVKAAMQPKAVLVFYTGNPDGSPRISVQDILGPAANYVDAIALDGSGPRGPKSECAAVARQARALGYKTFVEAAEESDHWCAKIAGSFSYPIAIKNMQRDGWKATCRKPHFILLDDESTPMLGIEELPNQLGCYAGWASIRAGHTDHR